MYNEIVYHLPNGKQCTYIIDEYGTVRVTEDVMKLLMNTFVNAQWVPCDKGLPSHGSRVLVTATHKKLGHTAVDVLRYHGDEYGWEGSDFCTVTAWMPLPDVWDGEEDER